MTMRNRCTVLGYHLEDASIVGTDIYQANQTLARVGAGGGLGGGGVGWRPQEELGESVAQNESSFCRKVMILYVAELTNL